MPKNKLGEGVKVIAQLYLLVVRHVPSYDPQEGEYGLFISEEGARQFAMKWLRSASETYRQAWASEPDAIALLDRMDEALRLERYLDADDIFEVLADRYSGLTDRFYIEKVDLYAEEDVFLREGLVAFMMHPYMKGDETASSDYDVTLSKEESQRALRGWLKDAYEDSKKWHQEDDLGAREYGTRMGQALASADFKTAWITFWEWVKVGGNRNPDRIVVREIPLRP